MKILEIASFFPPQGGAFVLDQARALRSLGHEVSILYCNQLGISHGLWQWLFPSFHTPHPSSVSGTYLRSIPKCTHLNQKRWVSEILRQYDAFVREHGTPDVVHAQCSVWAGVAAMTIARHSSLPYFVTEHIPLELFEREFGQNWCKHPWAGPLLRDVYRNAQCVIHVASEQYEWLAPLLGRDYRHTYISNVIDTDFFIPRPESLIPNPSSRILCLSISDIHRKGLDVLAEACRELPDCELTLAGRGTDGQAMKELFRHYPNVRLLGELDRISVRELLYNSDVLVLPSRSEVQPLVLLEAMCMGLPVVTTDAVTTCVRIPDACFVAQVGNSASLVQQLRLALAHGPLTHEKTEEVRSLVSPSAIAQQLTDLFSGK